MEQTIEAMKESRLFQCLVNDIVNRNMSKKAVADSIDQFCEMNEDFEDIFLQDAHELAVNVIWNELQYAVDRLPKKEDRNNKEIIDLLKQVLDKLN